MIERGRTNTALPTSRRPDVGGRPGPAAGHGAGGEHQPSGVIHQWCKSDCRARVEQGNRTDNDTRIPTVDRLRMAIDRASCESVLVAIIGRRNDGWLNSLGPGLRRYDVRSERCLQRRDRSGGLFPALFVARDPEFSFEMFGTSRD